MIQDCLRIIQCILDIFLNIFGGLASGALEFSWILLIVHRNPAIAPIDIGNLPNCFSYIHPYVSTRSPDFRGIKHMWRNVMLYPLVFMYGCDSERQIAIIMVIVCH